MRPIDKIRERIDSDFSKYKSSNLFQIKKIKSFRGSGVCAIVCPINRYNSQDPKILQEDQQFKVFIVNYPGGWIPKEVVDKFFVLILNQVKDSNNWSAGVLVPTGFVQEADAWTGSFKDAASGKTLIDTKWEGFINAK